ncbi:MAG: glutathione S-transferase family protein [Myxococcota bacterium]|nr:glutathione S-transferase family protein [Myxococcota bacterium]
MGLLVNGEWKDRWYDTAESSGRFVRQDSRFRSKVTRDGSSPFPAEAGRYHLYVAWACPWAHRTLIVRALKGLTDIISASFVGPDMLSEGWQFDDTHPDHLFGHERLYQLYAQAAPDYTGRVTVPVLWDKQTNTLVNNESAEIIRMFNTAFTDLAAPLDDTDLYPAHLRAEIDAINDVIYRTINNGVYRAGFATTQTAYDEAVAELFESLDAMEARLAGQAWLVGGQPTEADWRLLPTLLRFDAVYHHHFKCSLRRLRDYPALWAYTKRLYQRPGIAETFNMTETRRHYFYSHESINPHRVIPIAPDFDLSG